MPSLRVRSGILPVAMTVVWWSTLAQAQALPLPEQRACDEGSAAACTVLGDAYATGVGVPKDEFRAADLFRRGCDLGDPRACLSLAEAHRTGNGALVDPKRALQLYSRACEGQEPLACRAVGDLYTLGALGDADGKAAGYWYWRACTLEDAHSCTAAGLWVERGEARRTVGSRDGLPLFERACDAGDHRACALLGERLLRGVAGARRDPGAAYGWFTRGCEPPEDLEACRALGVGLLDGRYLPRDEARGVVLLERACEQHDPTACARLAVEHLARGAWAEALIAAEDACDFGARSACRTAAAARGHLSVP